MAKLMLWMFSFRPTFNVINGDGVTLDEDWGTGPNLYLELSAPRFPNFYTIVVSNLPLIACMKF